MSGKFTRVIVAMVLTGALILSATAIANATAPQLWYLDSTDHHLFDNANSAAMPVKKVMEKTLGMQSGSVDVPSNEYALWLAENPAVVDVTFPGGLWIIEIKTDGDGPAAAGGDSSSCPTPADRWQAWIGGWDTDTGWYFVPITKEATYTWDGGRNVLMLKLQTGPVTIEEGDYLALGIKNRDSCAHTIFTDGRSSLRSPDTDPGYPLPELPSAILLGTGFVGLLGYLGLRRYKASTKV